MKEIFPSFFSGNSVNENIKHNQEPSKLKETEKTGTIKNIHHPFEKAHIEKSTIKSIKETKR
jgi:hypothetical protein